MAPEDAQRLFAERLAAAGLDLATLRPADGIDAMLAFYADERAERCVLDDDGDMLLYQWGTNDWGQGEAFDINITRQFIRTDADDDDILQLSLTFHYAPTPERRELGASNAWCAHPSHIADFEAGIRQNVAFGVHAGVPADNVTLEFSETG